jgi:hypothetical protein
VLHSIPRQMITRSHQSPAGFGNFLPCGTVAGKPWKPSSIFRYTQLTRNRTRSLSETTENQCTDPYPGPGSGRTMKTKKDGEKLPKPRAFPRRAKLKLSTKGSHSLPGGLPTSALLTEALEPC